MTLQEIKTALDSGKTVHWLSDNYIVTGDLLIKCVSNGHCIGLTWMDGVTLNGKECDFYLGVDNNQSNN